jgi:glycosyltransferase involved in cell wall biosynthesis
VLGYIGTLGMAHKIDFLLDCVKDLKDYSLLVMGEGAEKEKIKQKIKDENITNVVLLDSVPKDKVADYVALQDAAIINLRRDPLFKTVIPSKIFETAAMQVPILLGVDGEAREIVEQYRAGLFYEPEDKADFLDKLNTLFGSEQIYGDCRKGGEKLAVDYDRKRLALNMLDILCEMKR